MSDSPPPYSAAEARARKRERDKRSQQRKRQRERERVSVLELTIRELQGQLRYHVCPSSASLSCNTAGISRNDTADPIGGAEMSTTIPVTNTAVEPSTMATTGMNNHSYGYEMPPFPTAGTPMDSDVTEQSWQQPAAMLEKHFPTSHDPPTDEQLDASTQQEGTTWQNPQYGLPHPAIASPFASARDHGEEETISVPFSLLDALLTSPVWQRTPRRRLSSLTEILPEPNHHFDATIHELSLRRHDVSVVCHARPQPVDILYGGSDNPLANVIAAKMSIEPILAPEHFAWSWLMYLYGMWLIDPTQDRFEALPSWLHPTTLQLSELHPSSADLVIWPVMRDNIIRYSATLDMAAVHSLFVCTCRLRGAFNAKFIKRTNNGDLELDTAFERIFLDVEKWGLLDKFWVTYPQLVEKLDQSIRMSDADLLPP